MARKLIVEIIGDSTRLVRSFNQSTTAANKFGMEVTGTAGRAERSLTKLQRVAAGGFIGAAALSAGAVAFRRLFDAAAESQQVLGQTQVALESTGKSWQQYGETIQEAVAAQSRLGFDDEALLRTFSLFVRQSGDVQEALRRNNIAMNVARARFLDLEQAAALVNKAALGQAGALRRVGIDARTGASGVELLTQLERQFAGAAEDASQKAVGATDRLRVSLENVEETLGSALLPVVTEFAVALSDAADGATLLAEKLRALGSIRIPVINIPFNFEFPGTNFSVTDLGKEIFKRTGPFSALFNTADLVRLLRGNNRGDADTRAAAEAFEAQFNPFFEGVEEGQKRVQRKAKSFGQKGFKPLPTNDLGDRMTEQFEAMLDSLELKLDRAQVTRRTSDDLAVLDEMERAVRQRIQTHGRTTDLMRQLFEVQQERTAILQQAADERGATQQEAVDALFGRLELRVDRAALTRTLRDDLAALTDLQTALRRQIAKGGDIAALQSQLVSVIQQIRDTREQIDAAAGEALQARQFRALGLNETGGELIPGIENLRKQFQQLTQRIGSRTISSKMRSQLAGIRRVLSGELGKATEETRERMRDILQAIRGGLDDLNKGPLTKTTALNANRLLDGLGLGRDMERELRARLSRFNSAGLAIARPGATVGRAGTPVVESHVTVNVDGQTLTKVVTKGQVKTGRGTRQKRGPNRRSGI